LNADIIYCAKRENTHDTRANPRYAMRIQARQVAVQSEHKQVRVYVKTLYRHVPYAVLP
jgi:hypothetical protein